MSLILSFLAMSFAAALAAGRFIAWGCPDGE
jgi:hypothetical protein